MTSASSSIETTTNSGKSRGVYYGADGTLEKVAISASPAPDAKRGLRGKIVENKTAELTGYMQDAVSLVKTYVPPDPDRIQAAKDAGKVTMTMLDPGQTRPPRFPELPKAG